MLKKAPVPEQSKTGILIESHNVAFHSTAKSDLPYRAQKHNSVQFYTYRMTGGEVAYQPEQKGKLREEKLSKEKANNLRY
jgi:hypothetical protein